MPNAAPRFLLESGLEDMWLIKNFLAFDVKTISLWNKSAEKFEIDKSQHAAKDHWKQKYEACGSVSKVV